MRIVYSPADSVEAHMLAHMLEQAGIEAHIHGEALQGAAGELPASGLVKLMVADERYDEARQLLLAWERRAPPAETAQAPQRRRFAYWTALASFAFGALAAGAVIATVQARLAAGDTALSALGASAGYDTNNDGADDIVYFYRPAGGALYRSTADNNFDGAVDEEVFYDERGFATRAESDHDFDGRMETTTVYRYGLIAHADIDTDGNGVSDLSYEYENGILATEAILDPGRGTIARINHYDAFRIVRAELDLDHDGFLETEQTFDRYGLVTSTRTRRRP